MTIKRNLSIKDRRIRFALGVIILALGVYFRSWWGVLSLPFMLTALINTCPIYMMLGISTYHDTVGVCPPEEATPENTPKQ